MVLSVPVCQDLLVWNTGRIYGRHRLPHTFEHWHVGECFGFTHRDFDRESHLLDNPHGHQPIWVLTPEGNDGADLGEQLCPRG